MAIAKVQSVTGNGATLVLNTVVAGNTLIDEHSYFRAPSNGVAASTPTDSNGTFSIASADVPATFTSGTTDDVGQGIWYQGNAAAGTHTVTPQALNGHNGSLTEYSGLAASPFDVAKSAVTNNGTQTSQVTGTTAATAQADELVVIGLALGAAAGVANVGLTDPVSGFTTLQVNQTDSTGLAGMHAFKVISATGTQSATFNWTDNEANQASHGAIATFKAAAADIGSVVYQRTRAGRGPGAGPSMRRMLPQQFPTPSLIDTVSPGQQIQPLRSRGPGMGPRLRRMVPQRFQDASTSTTTTLLPTEGAITIAGVAASLTLTIAAVAGAITIAGNAPSVTTILQGVQGSVVIAGNAASTTSILAPAVGAVVISGSAPALTQTLVGVTGAVTIGGSAPSLAGILGATDGAIVIGGNAPSLVVSSGLSPAEGAIILAGNAPDLLAALSVSEGAIYIGGNVPSLIIPTSASETFSGGYGEFARRFRTRAEEELRKEREQWGILPKAAQIVAAVAIRQADALDLDAEQRLEELERELELAGVQYQARYLELLNLQRQRLIDAEIRGFFEAEEALGEENKRRLMLLLAFLS